MSRYRKILLLSTENSDPKPAFERAVALARAMQAELTLLDIAEPMPEETQALIDVGILKAIETASLEQRMAVLKALATEAEAKGVPVATKTASGSPFRVAIRAVLSGGYDLVAKTIDTRDARSRATHGSTDKHLLRKCPCPVWLAAAADEPAQGHIVAAVNPDPGDPEDNALSTEILEAAAAIAALDGTAVDAVHAWKVFGELLLRGPKRLVSDREVDHIVGQALNRHSGFLDDLVARAPLSGVVVRKHLVHARPADGIIDFVEAHPTRLLVMGTVGRTGIPGLLIGNTAERVLSEVTCSVFALKPRGFVSPVTLDS